jgi:hypothetical protein
MSQNGRREFLTSAAAAAAALAACTAPARRAQAQHCATIYDEQDIVSKVAPFISNSPFRNQLITFPANIQPTMGNLNQNPQLVNNTLTALSVTLAALAGPNGQGLTTVTVKNENNLPTGLPSGTNDLIPLGTTSAPNFQRSPVVLSLQQYQAGSFNPDWSKILLFVIPDPRHPQDGQPVIPREAVSAMCAHPFGM